MTIRLILLQILLKNSPLDVRFSLWFSAHHQQTSKSGLSYAILEGVISTKVQIIVVMDSDLPHPLEVLPATVQKIGEGVDIVMALHYVGGGRISKWSLKRSS
jgi:hypothetical protein